MKATRFITLLILLTLVLTSFSLAAAANPPIPSPGTATVDGDYSEWDLSNDYFAAMGEGFDPANKHASDLFVRYDCSTATLYTLVLAVGDYVIDPNGDVWVAINGSPSNKLNQTARANSPDGLGVEASYDLNPGSYTILAHVNVDESKTSATPNDEWIGLNVTCFDYGDLPDESGKFSGYTLYENGARHEKGALFLGGQINMEVDGKPDANAAKDEYDDGIVPLGNWNDSEGEVQVTVTGGEACLYGWLDFSNGTTNDPDFDFDDPGEEIISGELVSAASSPQVITFSLPAGEIAGSYFARFRLFSADVCGDQVAIDLPKYQGLAVNGEVEDYEWTFGPNAVSMAGFTASAADGPSIWIAVVALISLAAITILAMVLRRQTAYVTDKS